MDGNPRNPPASSMEYLQNLTQSEFAVNLALTKREGSLNRNRNNNNNTDHGNIFEKMRSINKPSYVPSLDRLPPYLEPCYTNGDRNIKLKQLKVQVERLQWDGGCPTYTPDMRLPPTLSPSPSVESGEHSDMFEVKYNYKNIVALPKCSTWNETVKRTAKTKSVMSTTKPLASASIQSHSYKQADQALSVQSTKTVSIVNRLQQLVNSRPSYTAERCINDVSRSYMQSSSLVTRTSEAVMSNTKPRESDESLKLEKLLCPSGHSEEISPKNVKQPESDVVHSEASLMYPVMDVAQAQTTNTKSDRKVYSSSEDNSNDKGRLVLDSPRIRLKSRGYSDASVFEWPSNTEKCSELKVVQESKNSRYHPTCSSKSITKSPDKQPSRSSTLPKDSKSSGDSYTTSMSDIILENELPKFNWLEKKITQMSRDNSEWHKQIVTASSKSQDNFDQTSNSTTPKLFPVSLATVDAIEETRYHDSSKSLNVQIPSPTSSFDSYQEFSPIDFDLDIDNDRLVIDVESPLGPPDLNASLHEAEPLSTPLSTAEITASPEDIQKPPVLEKTEILHNSEENLDTADIPKPKQLSVAIKKESHQISKCLPSLENPMENEVQSPTLIEPNLDFDKIESCKTSGNTSRETNAMPIQEDALDLSLSSAAKPSVSQSCPKPDDIPEENPNDEKRKNPPVMKVQPNFHIGGEKHEADEGIQNVNIEPTNDIIPISSENSSPLVPEGVDVEPFVDNTVVNGTTPDTQVSLYQNTENTEKRSASPLLVATSAIVTLSSNFENQPQVTAKETAILDINVTNLKVRLKQGISREEWMENMNRLNTELLMLNQLSDTKEQELLQVLKHKRKREDLIETLKKYQPSITNTPTFNQKKESSGKTTVASKRRNPSELSKISCHTKQSRFTTSIPLGERFNSSLRQSLQKENSVTHGAVPISQPGDHSAPLAANNLFSHHTQSSFISPRLTPVQNMPGFYSSIKTSMLSPHTSIHPNGWQARPLYSNLYTHSKQLPRGNLKPNYEGYDEYDAYITRLHASTLPPMASSQRPPIPLLPTARYPVRERINTSSNATYCPPVYDHKSPQWIKTYPSLGQPSPKNQSHETRKISPKRHSRSPSANPYYQTLPTGAFLQRDIMHQTTINNSPLAENLNSVTVLQPRLPGQQNGYFPFPTPGNVNSEQLPKQIQAATMLNPGNISHSPISNVHRQAHPLYNGNRSTLTSAHSGYENSVALEYMVPPRNQPQTFHVRNPFDSSMRNFEMNLDERPARTAAQPKTTKASLCELCQRPAGMLCSNCRSVRYCSKSCQILGWKNHSRACRPPESSCV